MTGGRKKTKVGKQQDNFLFISKGRVVKVTDWMFMSSQNSRSETLIPNSKGEAFGRSLGLTEVMRVGSSWWLSALTRRGRQTGLSSCIHNARPCKNTVKEWLSTNQEVGCHQELNLPAPALGIPSLLTGRNTWLLFKPPSLQSFVIAAWAD